MFTYLVCDYGATGEGRTVSVLVQRSYVFESDYNDDGKTPQERMKEVFTREFDSWYAIGMEELDENEFHERFLWTMPETVWKILHQETPPGFSFKTQIHYNYS